MNVGGRKSNLLFIKSTYGPDRNSNIILEKKINCASVHLSVTYNNFTDENIMFDIHGSF